MPRKNNGFGKVDSFRFKPLSKSTKAGNGTGAAGSYPSDRQFGTLITRSAIEKYNIDSKWARWRRGYELYSRKCIANPGFLVSGSISAIEFCSIQNTARL